MTAIGSINAIANRQYEVSLLRSVATVDQQEADNGASQSDVVRWSTRQREPEGGNSVPLSVYLARAAQFRSQLKKVRKDEEPKQTECPIEKARAESTTGKNAPLGWLTADQFGGEAEFGPTGDDLVVKKEEPSIDHSAAVFTAQPKVSAEPQSFLADEWLLTPCA